jgi:hypothetical protein
MPIHVFLDDRRPCPPGFVLARTAEECILLLQECEVGVLSLDYDLGYGTQTGMDVVQAMIVSGKYPREIYIHSSSWVGRALMAQTLKDAAPPDVFVSDGPMPDEVLKKVAASSGNGEGN